MFNFRLKQKPKAEKRSLDELRKELRTIDRAGQAEIKGGQGARRAPEALRACGGWLPQ